MYLIKTETCVQFRKSMPITKSHNTITLFTITLFYFILIYGELAFNLLRKYFEIKPHSNLLTDQSHVLTKISSASLILIY